MKASRCTSSVSSWASEPIFLGRPTFAEWQGLLGRLARLHAEEHTSLVVIDPFSSFEQATYRLTRLEIGMRWPASPPPNAVTLFRWLERTVADGLVLRDGEGVRGFPFR